MINTHYAFFDNYALGVTPTNTMLIQMFIKFLNDRGYTLKRTDIYIPDRSTHCHLNNALYERHKAILEISNHDSKLLYFLNRYGLTSYTISVRHGNLRLVLNFPVCTEQLNTLLANEMK
jgi:hypothetical protein